MYVMPSRIGAPTSKRGKSPYEQREVCEALGKGLRSAPSRRLVRDMGEDSLIAHAALEVAPFQGCNAAAATARVRNAEHGCEESATDLHRAKVAETGTGRQRCESSARTAIMHVLDVWLAAR